MLHEPGPIGMETWTTQQGFRVTAGDEVRLSSIYDAERPHTRVMGIDIVYFAPDPTAAGERCSPLPTDVRSTATSAPSRTRTPVVTVPLTGLDGRGRAIRIDRPPGRTVRAGASARVAVVDRRFSKPNLSVNRGARVTWDFKGPSLHDVTLASGPRGFSSHHLDRGRYKRTLGTPGTYRLFCSLHPVSMTQRIVVR